ncbi:MAG: hypothetical protein ABSF55_02200 [Candidatus Staskawiczbacteria bacterium]|jgi:hypothetical protein
MQKREIKVIIILIIIGLVIFVIGAGLGVFYQTKKDAIQIQQDEKISAEIQSLSSDIVTAVAAYGKVVAINGRDVTLSYSGKSLTINVGENVPVTSFSAPAKGSTQGTSQNLKFSDIKTGDNLSIALKIGQDGKLAAQTVLVLTSSNSAAQ